MDPVTGSVSIDAQNIMPIIKKWLYSDKDIFIREVVSNACDAITKLRLVDYKLAENCSVHVEVDKAAKTLRFIDDGVGMTQEEVEKNINQVAFSGAKSFLEEYAKDEDKENSGIIGHFGLGFYSVFMVADKVTIDTLSFREGATPVRWESADGMSFTMTDSDRTTRGTTITLYINDAEEEFLNYWRVHEVLERYCSFMAYPIYLEEIKPEEEKKQDETEATVTDENGEVVKTEGEEEAKEEAAKPEPKPINDTTPLYVKAPQDCTDEDYKAFYRKVFHEYEDPLFWIHLNVDYPFKLKGILYFPKLKEQFGGIEGQIKLYSGQVFVADNIKEVIPEWLMLLKGVIDCADFPLNVSRSFLQNDGYVRRISTHITKKVADKLTGMFKTEREAFEGFWPDIHPFIKYGMMRDEKFAERMKDCVLFKTTEGKFLTLAEYKERNGEKLSNKMVYTSDAARQDAAIRLFTERGIDVAVLDQAIDVNFVSYMEYSATAGENFKFCRVDAELESLTAEGEAEALDQDKLTALIREAAGKDDLTVEVKPLANESIPLMLIEDEQTRRFNDMGRIYGRSEYTMPAKYSVVLNSRNKTVKKLASREKDERSLLLTRQLYDLAELSRQPLEAEQMTEFIRRSMEIVDIASEL
ncbi:MAG: molecular chaperone HtpG [Clostridiales bacterium]|nr:molecular chaperone HtpG [Clostridiales bacterium]MDY4541687.1 molecular chaperone HtpG [Candidatus Ventricola sp.]